MHAAAAAAATAAETTVATAVSIATAVGGAAADVAAALVSKGLGFAASLLGRQETPPEVAGQQFRV